MRGRSILGALNAVLGNLPVRVETTRRLQQLEQAQIRLDWIETLCAEDPMPETLPRGQLGQDLFVLHATGFKRGGFFVEFGAADGVNLSNTYLLERSFGWRGILAEPGRAWHDELRRCRSCIVDERCVWSSTRERLKFRETEEAEYSTVEVFVDRADPNADRRKSGFEYEVETVSLNDLLDEHSAPSCIDYLSVDTEGSEYEILNSFNFRDFEINVITVEHNYHHDPRANVHDLLAKAGFVRVFEEMSQFDDWYVRRELAASDRLRIHSCGRT